MQERRKFERVFTPVVVEFEDPRSRRKERSFTQDISEAGMRFPTTILLQIGQELNLSLTLSHEDASFAATGRVVWIREISRIGSTQYEVGVQFHWVEDPDRQRLAAHLSTILQRDKK
ncbi:MAG: PilZ domain-containing protein [Candidatus Omnitrophica bacterium]|nr:PilZ domain-containing protein [Candidatus Omnitrophota bacterium]